MLTEQQLRGVIVEAVNGALRGFGETMEEYRKFLGKNYDVIADALSVEIIKEIDADVILLNLQNDLGHSSLNNIVDWGK